VRSGPRYIPHGGPLAVGPAFGDPKVAQFRFEAEFDSDPANGIYPSCCEVRQYLRWNAAAAAGHQAMRGGAINTPHSGFPNNWPTNRWIEDRDSSNNRYGRRGGRHSDPGPGDQYLDNSGRQNQAFGHRYRGSDAPGGPAALAGRWEFLIKVIDVCNGNVDVGGIDRVFVDW